MTDIRPIPPDATPPQGNQDPAPSVTPASAVASAAAAAKTPAGDTQAGGQPPVAAAPSPSTVPTTPAPDTDNELLEGQPDNLKELYKQLPPEIRAANHKVMTEKFQRIAGDAKLIETLKNNPTEFAQALAEKVGLKVQPTPTEAATAAKTTTEELAPFFEGNTQAAQAFEGLLTKVIQQTIAPTQEKAERAINNALLSEAQASEARFLAKHPDGKQYDTAIGEYMRKVQPGPDVTDDEFLEMAYSWATKDKRSGAQVVETVERLTDAGAAAAGNQRRSADNAPISEGPPQETPTAAQAIAAAVRGVRWER